MTGQEIADAVNKIIAEIPREARAKMGAINWGDLRCRGVIETRYLWPEEDPEVDLEVLIEEADDSNYDFHLHVYEHLLNEYGVSVAVRTEW